MLGLLSFLRSPSVLILAGAFLGGTIVGGSTMGFLKDHKISKMEAAYAKLEAKRATVVVAETQRVGRINSDVSAKEVEKQVEVRWRTKTLRERVPQVLPVQPSVHVIGGGDLVPVGALGLLDEAAGGSSPAEAFTSGRTLDTSSGVTFSRVVDAVIDNYGIARGNAEQLGGLIEWNRRVLDDGHSTTAH